jgi:2'-5' RNA ligase
MKTFTQFLKEELYIEDNIEKTTGEEEIHYPSGVYIATKLSEITETYIKEYCNKYLKNEEINEDLHCTLIYSKKEHKEKIEPEDYKFLANSKEFSIFGDENKVLVMEINCAPLIRRNKELVEKYNFISDFSEYKPHITIAFNPKVDLNFLPPFEHSIELEGEYVEELDDSWNKDSDDKDGDKDGDNKSISDILSKFKKEQDAKQ